MAKGAIGEASQFAIGSRRGRARRAPSPISCTVYCGAVDQLRPRVARFHRVARFTLTNHQIAGAVVRFINSSSGKKWGLLYVFISALYVLLASTTALFRFLMSVGTLLEVESLDLYSRV